MSPKGTNLSAADRAIWQRVTRTVTPTRRIIDKAEKNPQICAVKPAIDRGPFMRVTPQNNMQTRKIMRPVEPTEDKRVRRGRIQINRRVDLHDLTREQAQPKLFNAVRTAYAKDEKCLLVITGKGVRLKGVLRQSFTDWINDDEVRPMIASYASSHIRHGGSGAWYVFIKRRKAGRL